MTSEAREFLHGDTVMRIKDIQVMVRHYQLNLERGFFPDEETRASFIVNGSRRLSEIAEEMANTVLLIAEHKLFEHEYAAEIQACATMCYAAAVNTRNDFERKKLAA